MQKHIILLLAAVLVAGCEITEKREDGGGSVQGMPWNDPYYNPHHPTGGGGSQVHHHHESEGGGGSQVHHHHHSEGGGGSSEGGDGSE